MEAFGIFEGGGVRGLGLVGALEVTTSKYDYNFIGVAGTSAGAIVAALYAARWPIKEILAEIQKKEFVDFLDGFSFSQTKEAIKELSHLSDQLSKNRLRMLTGIACNTTQLRSVFDRLVKCYGVFDGSEFVNWLDGLLRRYVKSKEDRITFESFAIPLKVVTTRLYTQESLVYDKKNWPKKAVADAVRASISIPFFFKPISEGSEILVDGGLMSNFPAWVFDDERKKIPITIPTIGFRLVEDKISNRIDDIVSFATAVLWTGLGAYKGLQTRGIENLIEVPIPTKGISFVKFDLSVQEKELLLCSGRQAAHDVLMEAARPKPARIIVLQLEGACNAIKRIVGDDKHLRANIFLPSGGGKVKIFYQYNMDADSDREFELAIDAGVTGRCWESKEEQIVDLAEVRQLAEADPNYLMTKWKFRPQDQAAVRKTLQSLLSVPIRDPGDSGAVVKTGTLIGVLNFDSDNTIEAIGFNKTEVLEIAMKYAEAIANLLKS